MSVLAKEGANPKSMVFDVAGGIGGIAGDPGIPGLPGAPGPDGFTKDWFVTTGGCPDMGPVGTWGSPGVVPAANATCPVGDDLKPPEQRIDKECPNGKAGKDGPRPEIKIIP